jgi:hypothetical protein
MALLHTRCISCDHVVSIALVRDKQAPGCSALVLRAFCASMRGRLLRRPPSEDGTSPFLLCVEVADNGQGPGVEDTRPLFRPFYLSQVHSQSIGAGCVWMLVLLTAFLSLSLPLQSSLSLSSVVGRRSSSLPL